MSELLSTRLNKYISQSGLCSRRDADKFIEQGHVFINGRRAEVGDRVFTGSKVAVNGQQIEPMDDELLVLIALNKPVGVVSTTEGSERDNIVDFVGHSSRIFPIGRLDKDSQGLIFLTNNGDLVNKILRAGNQHEKEYLVTVNRPITEDLIQGLIKGVPILGVVTKKCKVSQVSQFVFKMTLIQGLNRQIRRMCEYFNYEVKQLERTRIMNVSLKGLTVGDWRDLSPQELNTIVSLTDESSSEMQVPKKAKSSHKSNFKSQSLSAAIEKNTPSNIVKPNRKEQLKNLINRKKPAAQSTKKRTSTSVKGQYKNASKITPKPARNKSTVSKKQRNR